MQPTSAKPVPVSKLRKIPNPFGFGKILVRPGDGERYERLAKHLGRRDQLVHQAKSHAEDKQAEASADAEKAAAEAKAKADALKAEKAAKAAANKAAKAAENKSA